MELAYRKTAREYYTDSLFGNLLTAVFKKYQGQNGVKGNAQIRVTSGAEAERLQNYFGNRLSRLIHPGTVVEVPLKVFAEELQLGYNLSIPDLYELLYNQTLLTKLEQRQLMEEAWNRLFEQVRLQLKEDVGFDLNDENFRNVSFNWFERLQTGQVPGYRVLKNVLNKGEKAGEVLFLCMKGLWYLLVGMEAMLKELNISVNKVRIPVFAAFVTKDKDPDPHGFDWKESAGRLLWYALYNIDQQRVRAGQESTSENMIVPEYMQKRQVYRNFGLMDDNLSSFSHVFAPYFVSGTSPRTLNLGEIQTYGKFPAYLALYAFENPAVFSHIVDELVYFLDRSGLTLEQIPEKFPALVCTSGQPRSAALAFITECLKANPACPVRYSGDLDLPGVQMMWGMQKQFTVNFEALRMDVRNYRNHSDLPHLLLSLQDKKVLEKEQDNLAKVMVELGIKVYQEELVQDLTEDVLEVIRQEVEKG